MKKEKKQKEKAKKKEKKEKERAKREKLNESERKRLSKQVEMKLRAPMRKLQCLEGDLTTYMASQVVAMLPVIQQSDVNGIFQEVQTTYRKCSEAIENKATQEPQCVANVNTLLEKGKKLSLWLKRLTESYNLRTV